MGKQSRRVPNGNFAIKQRGSRQETKKSRRGCGAAEKRNALARSCSLSAADTSHAAPTPHGNASKRVGGFGETARAAWRAGSGSLNPVNRWWADRPAPFGKRIGLGVTRLSQN